MYLYSSDLLLNLGSGLLAVLLQTHTRYNARHVPADICKG